MMSDEPFNVPAWRKAQNIAFVVMGKRKVGRHLMHEAHDDPLAHHLLAEIIYEGTLPR